MDKATFDNITWLTSGARFNASRRLLKQNRLALYGAAMLSLASTLLATSAVPWSGYAASVASAFALMFSLIEAAAEHGVKAERLHQCAVHLRELMYQAKADDADMVALNQRYHQVISECPENHTPLDMDLVKAQAEKNNKFALRYELYSYSLYWLIISVALSLIITGH